MEKKQTAVQWLFLMLNNPNGDQLFANKLLNKALEIEKEQIVKAHGNKLKKSGGVSNYEYWMSGEEYYNDTYKSE